MNLEISIVNIAKVDDKYLTTFKYWESGKCACLAEKIQTTFDKEPTYTMIKEHIAKL